MPGCGYEFYLLALNSITHSFAALTREISNWTREDDIHISSRACSILQLLYCKLWAREDEPCLVLWQACLKCKKGPTYILVARDCPLYPARRTLTCSFCLILNPLLAKLVCYQDGWILVYFFFAYSYTLFQNGRHFSIFLFPCKLACVASSEFWV